MTDLNMTNPKPRVIAWELTRSCNLACAHCRASASYNSYQGELSTEECYRLIDDISSMGKSILILSGGEPLLREDFFSIAGYAARRGLRVASARAMAARCCWPRAASAASARWPQRLLLCRHQLKSQLCQPRSPPPDRCSCRRHSHPRFGLYRRVSPDGRQYTPKVWNPAGRR